jgi:predicted transcriptional regulator of viral defense system
MGKTRIEIAKADIIKVFDKNKITIYKRADIQKIMTDNREFWRLAQSTTLNQFIGFLLEKTKLKQVKLEFPIRQETRYTWGDFSIYELVCGLKPKSYLSHYTAVVLHELTEQIPKTIYLNLEQPPKYRGKVKLEQSQIDSNFKRPVKQTNYIATYKDMRICILNGMHTDNLGAVEFGGNLGEKITMTNLERTLIDIAVRPVYSGGIFEVLKAYRNAKNKNVSINKLTSYLKQINYVYPYHQVIGFYLDMAGNYEKSQIDLLQKFKIEYDFYLTHQMKDVEYSSKWRLYYPKGFL